MFTNGPSLPSLRRETAVMSYVYATLVHRAC